MGQLFLIWSMFFIILQYISYLLKKGLKSKL